MADLRVLTLIDGFRMGGAETLLAPLAGASGAAGIDMEFVSVSPETVNAEKTMAILRDAGVSTRSLNIRRLLDPSAIPKLWREIRRFDYDVVHAHLEMAMTLAVPAAALARRPVVCTFHNVYRPLEGRAEKRARLAVEAASRSDKAIFVSEESRESYRARYRPQGMPENWVVVHNGINVANFSPGAADPVVRRELGGGSGPLVVAPGAFRDFKGLPVAIDGWIEVLRAFPDAVLSLVGGGELEAELRAQVAAAELEDSVVFAGVRTDMPNVYRAADVVVVPSIYGENLPTVVIEASASGRPIAASRTGGIPDILADTGVLFEPGNSSAFAEAVCALLSDEALRNTLGAAAAVRANDEFSSAAWVRHLSEIYREAIRRHR